MAGLTIDYSERLCFIREALTNGNSDLALKLFLDDDLFLGVDWQEYPELETAFHITIYAVLYRGADQRMEDHIADTITKRLRTAYDRLGQPAPTVRVERAFSVYPPAGSVLCTAQEFQALLRIMRTRSRRCFRHSRCSAPQRTST